MHLQEPGPISSDKTEALQRVVKVRRDYNTWVASETMEDYALRFTPRSARRWSPWRVGNMAFGVSSFLVLEAVGATLLVTYGVTNAIWAILMTGLIILLAGLPISYYAAKYGVDMDLLTRGAGFGYIGSTLTSLIYASFTFIFFALEAAVMAYALELAFDIPPSWGYLLCAVVVVPLVTHGVTIISRLQVWTQPVWIILLVIPYVAVLWQEPDLLQQFMHYSGESGASSGFSWLSFGAALTVGIALITQMGEQADYLRFMPQREPGRGATWWGSLCLGGPGWIVPGVLKMLGGAFLAYLAIHHAVPTDRAVDPNQMYLVAWGYVFGHVKWAIAAVAIFVIVSQLKINVTNAYAGSLAWSNFFARLTHSHPGRVVWMLFNIGIALMLMELNVFQAIGKVLGLYSNLAIAWMMTVVADLVINKPLGLSPKGIEFKRAYLYDINPVGVGSMGIASLLSVVAYMGWLGPWAQAWSAMIALVAAMMAAPLIAWLTRGKYYLARTPESLGSLNKTIPIQVETAPSDEGRPLQFALHRCTVCEGEFEAEDTAFCPAYQGAICSLCCSLDARCQDLCKPHGRWAVQWRRMLSRCLPDPWMKRFDSALGHYALAMLIIVPLLIALFYQVYQQQWDTIWPLQNAMSDSATADLKTALQLGYIKAFAALIVITGVVVWWFVLTHHSRQVAQEESNRQTALLVREIESHRLTDEQLQAAKVQAERAQALAESANQAKSRYISAISHELRTPLNGVLGYAQLLDESPQLSAQHRHAIQVIRRGGDHLLSLIEGTLDIARIESGKLTLEVRTMRLAESLDQLVQLFELQAAAKGLTFKAELQNVPPAVRADEKRLRQILLNVLGNAIKFTQKGHVTLRVRYAREMAHIDIEDTGTGIPSQDLDRIFEPFARAHHDAADIAAPVAGTGLGLTISKMLTELMGGEMTVQSVMGQGTTFKIKLFLPQVSSPILEARQPLAKTGYEGSRRRLLIIDNESIDRQLFAARLEPLEFEVMQASHGDAALQMLDVLPPSEWPDAIFLDLAMPGKDGWMTLQALRHLEKVVGIDQSTPVAIVSANAFDRGVDNHAGIHASDFLIKPVRVEELLDWIGEKLQLTWRFAQEQTDTEPTVTLPSHDALKHLQEVVDSGHVKALHQALDQLERDEPSSAQWVVQARQLARSFQWDTLGVLIERAQNSHPSSID